MYAFDISVSFGRHPFASDGRTLSKSSLAWTETANILCKNWLSWGVGVNERAEGRKEELKKIGTPFANGFNMPRENMLEQEEHEEKKREGCTCCGLMICSYVTSVLVTCNAAWVINQLQGSEGSLYSLQNDTLSVHFDAVWKCGATFFYIHVQSYSWWRRRSCVIAKSTCAVWVPTQHNAKKTCVVPHSQELLSCFLFTVRCSLEDLLKGGYLCFCYFFKMQF